MRFIARSDAARAAVARNPAAFPGGRQGLYIPAVGGEARHPLMASRGAACPEPFGFAHTVPVSFREDRRSVWWKYTLTQLVIASRPEPAEGRRGNRLRDEIATASFALLRTPRNDNGLDSPSSLGRLGPPPQKEPT